MTKPANVNSTITRNKATFPSWELFLSRYRNLEPTQRQVRLGQVRSVKVRLGRLDKVMLGWVGSSQVRYAWVT